MACPFGSGLDAGPFRYGQPLPSIFFAPSGPEPGFVFWFVLAYIPLRLLLGRLVCPVGQDGQGAIID